VKGNGEQTWVMTRDEVYLSSKHKKHIFVKRFCLVMYPSGQRHITF